MTQKELILDMLNEGDRCIHNQSKYEQDRNREVVVQLPSVLPDVVETVTVKGVKFVGNQMIFVI